MPGLKVSTQFVTLSNSEGSRFFATLRMTGGVFNLSKLRRIRNGI
jgi:hypothetical protein